MRILDPVLEEQLIAQRRASGGDRYDEVWNGEYVMSPLANNEHQKLATKLAAIFHHVFGDREDVECLAGANVSDQELDWTTSYRCPDVVVVLPASRAKNMNTHWFGGPDLIVEIVSEGDASYQKFDFYSSIGVHEAFILDRDPWALELYRLDASGKLALAGHVELDSPTILHSEVLEANLSVVTKNKRPGVIVIHSASGRTWFAAGSIVRL